ncbi:hypothetical protein HK405_010520, partial [Cladochytrium tenue]
MSAVSLACTRPRRFQNAQPPIGADRLLAARAKPPPLSRRLLPAAAAAFSHSKRAVSSSSSASGTPASRRLLRAALAPAGPHLHQSRQQRSRGFPPQATPSPKHADSRSPPAAESGAASSAGAIATSPPPNARAHTVTPGAGQSSSATATPAPPTPPPPPHATVADLRAALQPPGDVDDAGNWARIAMNAVAPGDSLWKVVAAHEPRVAVVVTLSSGHQALALPSTHLAHAASLAAEALASAGAPPAVVSHAASLASRLAASPTAADANPSPAAVAASALVVESAADWAEVTRAVARHNRAMDRAASDRRDRDRASRELDEARAIVRGEDPALVVSVDVEAYERNPSKVLEIGWVMYHNAIHPPTLFSRHFVVAEHSRLRNGRYVPDHRFRFGFGRSRVAPLADVVALLRSDLALPAPTRSRRRPTSATSAPAAAAAQSRPLEADPPGATVYAATTAGSSSGTGRQPPVLPPPPPRLVLVGHGVSGDLHWLRSCGVDLRATAATATPPAPPLPETSPLQSPAIAAAGSGVAAVFDTSDLDAAAAAEGRPVRQRVGLSALCQRLGVRVGPPLHNA